MKNIGRIRYKCTFLVLLLLAFCIPIKTFADTEIRYEISIIKEADEDSPGIREYKNPDTGESIYEEIPATGHEWSDWIVDKEPTTAEEGHRYRICTKYPDNPHYEEEILPRLISANNQNYDKKDNALSKGNENNVDFSKEDKLKDEVRKTEQAIENNSDIEQENQIYNIDKNNIENEKEDLVTVEDKDKASKDTVMKSAKSEKAPAFASVNSVDALATVAFAGLGFWYIFILAPMIYTVIWIKQKKKR